MKDDLDLLIGRYLDGTASADEVERLDLRLRRDPAARRELLLSAGQDAALRDLAPPKPARRRWALAAGVAAAIGLAAIGLSPRPAPVARPPAAPASAPAPVAAVSPAPEVEAPPAVEVPAEISSPLPPAPEPVVPPAAPRPDPPRPEAKPAPAPRKAGTTAAAVGTVEGVQGDVQVVSGESRAPAVRGQTLLAGQGVETSGAESRASVRVGDDLSVELAPETFVSSVGRELTLVKGVLRADAARAAFSVSTPRARAEIQGGKLSVRAMPDATWLEVDRGQARFTRREDGASIQVAAGHRAAVAPGQPFQAAGREGVDQIAVDQAIAKGLEFLKASKLQGVDGKRAQELVLWTYVHAGVTEKDPEFKRLLDAVLKDPLEKTYNVALQAMLLEEIDRVRHQPRIVQCAQFLVDNQCKNGQWSYGAPTVNAEGVPTPSEAPRDVASGPPKKVVDFSEPKSKPKVVRKVPVRKQKDGPATGDNSNSQYAALGLRACHDAGVILPKDVVERAKAWWIACQGPDEAPDNGYGGVRGWGYKKLGPKDDPDDDKDWLLGSMTAGAVGSVVICDYMLGLDWKKDATVKSGMSWLASHFTVTDNPGGKPWRHYYYLYGLERAGILYGTEKIGPRAWYPEGARFLLDAQETNGSWKIKADEAKSKPVWDTCFAILFLKRATRPLQDVASVDRPKK